MQLFTTAEAAAYLRLKERKICEMVAEGTVPCTKVTGRWLFPKAELDHWLSSSVHRPAGVARPNPAPIVGGSHDPLLEWALRESGSGLAQLAIGSEAGFDRFIAGETLAAAIHLHGLEDPEADANVAMMADRGDTQSLENTIDETAEALAASFDDEDEEATEPSNELMKELVADRSYHSGAVLAEHVELGIRTYISEPKRGRRHWRDKREQRDATYANRRRIRGERGKRLARLRAEKAERSFAHCYETGGMRRTHLRGHENILKRLVIHVGGFNLALVMRKMIGIGKPRRIQGLAAVVLAMVLFVLRAIRRITTRWVRSRYHASVVPALPMLSM